MKLCLLAALLLANPTAAFALGGAGPSANPKTAQRMPKNLASVGAQLGNPSLASGSSGSFTMQVSATAPANDDCSSATVIAGAGPFAFDSTGATTSSYQFTACGIIGADVWFDWTASVTGTCTMSLCGSSFDSIITVSNGSGCPIGFPIMCNDDFCGLVSQGNFACTAGNLYALQIGGYFSATGPGSFTMTEVAPPPIPDDCSAPMAIAGVGFTAFNNIAATTGTEGQSESLCSFSGGTGIDHDLWFAWTSPSSGTASCNLCGGTVDTKIAVYAGSACPTAGSAIACNDDSCLTQSTVNFPATAGSTYLLQLGNHPGAPSSSGWFAMSVNPAPANDECSGATPIIGLGAYAFDTTHATTSAQPGLPCGQGVAYDDVWYSWTAPSSGFCNFTLCGSGVFFDSLIAVYDGGGCPGTGPIACNDDFCNDVSRCTFFVTAGHSYLLQIGSFTGGLGTGGFRLSIPAPPPPCTPWDDGSTESLLGWGAGGDMVWLNMFGALGQVNTVTSVDVMWGSALLPGDNPGNGTPTDVFIWVDGPTQDGDPSDATLLLSIPTTVTSVDTDTYVNFPITPQTISGYFFVGSHQAHSSSQSVAPMDMTSHVFQLVSWYFGDDTSPVANYADPGANVEPPRTLDTLFPAQWMLRVHCGSGPAIYLCEPGIAGTLNCPCLNPPSGLGRGCNNGAATGGAYVEAAGIASLAASTLTFTSHDQLPASSSMLIQGNAPNTGGLVFGHGVRCVYGQIRRMYVQLSSAGSATFPGVLDADIPTRSAALGDTIVAGTKRWYAIAYRDTTVLGGCSTQAAFNITNTAEVLWQ